ncbi:uncharacterized protein LOC111830941 [Capsella rubella]|nr:uncharacterized protein LOC111830941 [Capsella rubella]
MVVNTSPRVTRFTTSCTRVRYTRLLLLHNPQLPLNHNRFLFHTNHFSLSLVLLLEYQKTKMGSETFLEIILAILLPPVGVFLRYGCGVEFWICLLLTILGYIPGIIYAIYVLVG